MMKGLLLKDFYNLRKYGKMMFLISAFFIMMIFMMGNENLFLATIVIMFSATSISSFAYDEQAGWDTYVKTLPISKKDMVVSKYALSFLLALAGSLLALLVGWINGWLKSTVGFTEMLMISYMMFGVAVIFICILLPFIYKLGVERSRIIVLAFGVIPVSAVFVLAQTGALVVPDEQTLRQALLMSPFVIIACCTLSFLISYAVYRNKEV